MFVWCFYCFGRWSNCHEASRDKRHRRRFERLQIEAARYLEHAWIKMRWSEDRVPRDKNLVQRVTRESNDRWFCIPLWSFLLIKIHPSNLQQSLARGRNCSIETRVRASATVRYKVNNEACKSENSFCLNPMTVDEAAYRWNYAGGYVSYRTRKGTKDLKKLKGNWRAVCEILCAVKCCITSKEIVCRVSADTPLTFYIWISNALARDLITPRQRTFTMLVWFVKRSNLFRV